MDPRTRLLLLLCVGTLAICLETPWALGVLVVLCALPFAFIRVEGRWLVRGLVAVVAVVWSTTFGQALFYAEQPRVALLSLGPLTFYEEGVTYGLSQSLRFVAMSVAGLAVAISTPPDRMMVALKALGLPFGLSVMLASALRFLPEVARAVLTVRRARRSRGRPAWRRSPLAWMRLEVAMLRPVVARAWRRAQNLAESLDARGFDPTAARVLRRPLAFSWLDRGMLAAAFLLTSGVATGRLLFLLYVGNVAYFPSMRPVYGWMRHWL